jgi:hypothetical protein
VDPQHSLSDGTAGPTCPASPSAKINNQHNERGTARGGSVTTGRGAGKGGGEGAGGGALVSVYQNFILLSGINIDLKFVVVVCRPWSVVCCCRGLLLLSSHVRYIGGGVGGFPPLPCFAFY